MPSDAEYIRAVLRDVDTLISGSTRTLDPHAVRGLIEGTLHGLVEKGHISNGGEVKVTSFDSLEARVQHRILWKWLELRHVGIYSADLTFPLQDSLKSFMGLDERWLVGTRLISPNEIVPAEDDEDAYEVLTDPGHPTGRYLVNVEITPMHPINSIKMNITIGDEE